MPPSTRGRRARRPILQVERIATISIALAVAVLDVFDVATPQVVSSATLAVLTLLAFDVLTQRHETQRIGDAVQQFREFLQGIEGRLQTRSVDDFLGLAAPGESIQTAGPVRDIALVGVTLSRTIHTCLHDLECCLDSGGTVRIAVVDPQGDAPKEASHRHGLPNGRPLFDHRLQATVNLLLYLKSKAAGNGTLEIRFIPFVPSVGLTLIDPQAPHGVVVVDIYAHRPEAPEPSMTITAAESPEWYAHFLQEYEQVWNLSHPVASDSPCNPHAPQMSSR